MSHLDCISPKLQLSRDQMSTFDGYRCTGDKLSRPPAQPQASSENVAGLSDPTERDPAYNIVLELVQRGGHHLRWEGTKGESVDSDAVRGETTGEVAREAVQYVRVRPRSWHVVSKGEQSTCW